MNPLIGQALIAALLFALVSTGVGIYRTIRYAPPLERNRWIPAAVVFLATLLGFPLIIGSRLGHASNHRSNRGDDRLWLVCGWHVGLRLSRTAPCTSVSAADHALESARLPKLDARSTARSRTQL